MTEKRLIDAYKLEDLVRSNSARYHHADDVIAAIAGQPTVDAVEVVRCKDCKHWTKCESSLIGEAMCCTGQGSVNILKASNEFCSYGERREGE